MNATRDHDDSYPVDPRLAQTVSGSSTRSRPQLPPGTLLGERYRIIRMLGQGGMGSVYQARDEARSNLHVAVKLLAVQQPQALYRLKNEFRALAETVHPNLIGLHGLGADARGWFVVMDLIAPCSDFLSYVRAADEPKRADEGRLRSGLAQLLRGVAAIHLAGKLHRDLKPSNVLVSDEGRVVVADLGLVGDQEPGGEGHTQEGMFAGTPAYAAPEQARGQVVSTKADMYAIGVLLFEALTGRLPIEADSSHELLERKTRESAPDLSEIGPELPRDLGALCNALLRRDPAARPEASEALALLDEAFAAPAPLTSLPFVAREAELSALHDAMLTARQGAPSLALVTGPSGIGKSALVSRFLEELRRAPGTVQLRGRCHAHEQVPYNAFDALIDALGRYLSRLSPVDAASLMPRDVTLLARLFPTLLRVPAVLAMPGGRVDEGDEASRRLRAFAALKELLARIADRAFLVLCFDDLQWSDEDSRELLRELLRGPGAPAALFVCASRVGDPGEDPRVQAMLQALPDVTRMALPLHPLDAQAAHDLARSMLDREAGAADLSLLIEEAAGSPFLLKELSRGASLSGNVASLPETVAFSSEKLDADARTLLELVCVAGEPLELQLALRAAAVAPQALPAVLNSTLLRSALRDGRELLESSHQKISDAVLARVDPARQRELHVRLARALSAQPEPDPERIAHHYREGGDHTQATPHTIAAAQRAARVLAFGRATELYQQALAEIPESEHGALELALAEAYEHLGKLNEAAECFARAAQRETSGAASRELASKSMMLLLLAGQIERGSEALDRLCRELSVLAPPRRPWLAALTRIYLFLRFFLAPRMSTLPAPARAATEPNAHERIALCFRAARGLFNSRPDDCTHFSLLAMIETRRLREPYHWPLALAGDAMWRCVFHGAPEERCERDLEQALTLARGDHDLSAGVLAIAGICAMTYSRWQRSVQRFIEAERVLAASGRSPIQVYHATRSGQLVTFMVTGELKDMPATCEAWIAEARAQGDHYGELMVRQLGAYRFLALDDPASARQAIVDVRAQLASEHNVAEADAWWVGDVALYEQDAQAALAAERHARRSRFFSGFQRLPSHRVGTGLFAGRASLLAARDGSQGHLRRVGRLARKLERERLPLGDAGAAQLRAGLLLLRGDAARARHELERALAVYASFSMPLHVAAIQHQLGKLQGGEAGASQMQAARARASELGARNPERWFGMLLGF